MADKVITDAGVISSIVEAIGVVESGKTGLSTTETSLLFTPGDISDCNMTKQGLFRTKPSTLNLPSGAGNYCILISLNAYINGAYMIQFLAGLNTNNLYYRRKVDNTWGGWNQIVLG